MFAAVNTVGPPILELQTARLLEGDKPWNKERMPLVEDRVRDRLKQLSARLGDADWLDGAFSAGDLIMVSVLLRLRSSGLLDEFPSLAAYVARGATPATVTSEPSDMVRLPSPSMTITRLSGRPSASPSPCAAVSPIAPTQK